MSFRQQVINITIRCNGCRHTLLGGGGGQFGRLQVWRQIKLGPKLWRSWNRFGTAIQCITQALGAHLCSQWTISANCFCFISNSLQHQAQNWTCITTVPIYLICFLLLFAHQSKDRCATHEATTLFLSPSFAIQLAFIHIVLPCM